MQHTRLIHAVFTAPWAIERSMFGSIFSVLHARVFGDEQSAAARPPAEAARDPLEIQGALNAGPGQSRGGRFGIFRYGRAPNGALVNHTARIHAEASQRARSFSDYDAIVRNEEAELPAGQVLHVFGSGILGKHLSSMEESCSGGLSVDRIQSALRSALADEKVAAVMLHLDSPGGIVYGMPETAALVRALAAKKPVAEFCDSLTASAAKWCTCCADYSYITPSAETGSIGVYSAFVDYAKWCEKQGVSVKLITDGGAYKGAGFPGTSLTSEQEAKIQADVLACSAQFKADVRLGRRDIADTSMQGQCFTGAAAVAAGLADAVVPGLEEALADLAKTAA